MSSKSKPRSFNIKNAIQRAVALQQHGKLDDAERLYKAALKLRPRCFDALHLLGVLRGQQGDHESAIKLISAALAQNRKSAEAHSNLGIALIKLNRYEEAVASFNEALVIKPDDAGALENRARISLKLSRYEEAVASYDRLLELRPDSINALYERGKALLALRRYEEAIASFDRAISQTPDAPSAFYWRGNALHALQRHEEAIASFERALALNPTHLEALNNRGIALQRIGRHDDALASFNRALEVKPDDFDLLVNRGTALAVLGRYGEAVASYDKALTIAPNHAELLVNRGRAVLRAGSNEESIANFDESLMIEPDNAEALTGGGVALHALGRYTEAISRFDRALAIRADHAIALRGRGDALNRLKRYDEAVGNYEAALSLNPDLNYLMGAAAFLRARLCNWRDYALIEKSISDGVRIGKLVCTPFSFVSINGRPADQLACAALHVRDRCPTGKSRQEWRPNYYRERTRIAYLSADFHDHAMSNLMVGLFEQHDRKRFEVFAISFGSDKPSELRSRLKEGFEHFIDVREKSDEEVARLVRESEVDILVDLMGFTRNCRPRILALRPAPIQVNYLGYPGTMGADFIDYIIADEFVIPRSEQHHYSEKVVYLPDCFQANDSKRKIGERTPTRAEAGLPGHGFVFCCFNNSYKIKPQVFDVWMRVLQHVEGSVLWLLGENDTAIANLRREAQSRGVDPGRLVFAKRVRAQDYLARYRLADLFLDTLPFNAGTTASDALWAGVPLVTCAGETFAARMAGSLLHAVGLPELVTHSLEDYEALAVKLATDVKLLSEIKEKLARNRLTKPLFDTDRFRRHIEVAYKTMWEIHQRGEEPRSFAVAAVD